MCDTSCSVSNETTTNEPKIFVNLFEIFLDSVDCGIKVLNCCNTPRCRLLGTTKTFLTILILLGIVQGICEKFITISVHQAALEHDFDANVIGKFQSWLLIFSFISFFFVNIFRMVIHFERYCARCFSHTYCVLGQSNT